MNIPNEFSIQIENTTLIFKLFSSQIPGLYICTLDTPPQKPGEFLNSMAEKLSSYQTKIQIILQGKLIKIFASGYSTSSRTSISSNPFFGQGFIFEAARISSSDKIYIKLCFPKTIKSLTIEELAKHEPDGRLKREILDYANQNFQIMSTNLESTSILTPTALMRSVMECHYASINRIKSNFADHLRQIFNTILTSAINGNTSFLEHNFVSFIIIQLASIMLTDTSSLQSIWLNTIYTEGYKKIIIGANLKFRFALLYFLSSDENTEDFTLSKELFSEKYSIIYPILITLRNKITPQHRESIGNIIDKLNLLVIELMNINSLCNSDEMKIASQLDKMSSIIINSKPFFSLKKVLSELPSHYFGSEDRFSSVTKLLRQKHRPISNATDLYINEEIYLQLKLLFPNIVTSGDNTRSHSAPTIASSPEALICNLLCESLDPIAASATGSSAPNLSM